MYKKQSVSLVFPAYNEEENIGQAVKDFATLKIFDEIIVVDNNSSDQTRSIAKKCGARVISEKKQGYGFALRCGLAKAKGELVMLSEPDGTFVAKDALRLLQHTNNFDLVAGTRTNPAYINSSANMKTKLRLGNYVLAKLLQVLFQTSDLTDCGCTFRVFNRQLLKKILPNLTVGGSHFLPETVIQTALNGGKIKEIPVHYGSRIGDSKITGSLTRSVLVGWEMLKLIVNYRLRQSNSFPNRKSPNN